MDKEIIVVKQLPVIVEQLQTIKADVIGRTTAAMSLVCDESTVQEIKAIRAEFNKEFAYWEAKRKEVKKAVMSPYEQFEAVYKDCVTEVFAKADADLKNKIASVEDEIKARKEKEVLCYFNEYLCAAENKVNTPLSEFITLGRVNINITLSVSLKSLKKQVAEFIDRICDDVNLIETQEHKEEILYEYKQSLNVSAAITTVTSRYKAIEETKAKEAERKAQAEATKKAAEKVIETLTPPKEEEPIIATKITVRGTKSQLKALKEFLVVNGYDFE